MHLKIKKLDSLHNQKKNFGWFVCVKLKTNLDYFEAYLNNIKTPQEKPNFLTKLVENFSPR
jgi:hypothetical protein